MKVTLNHRVLASFGIASACAFGMGQANGVTGFGSSQLWHDYFSTGTETPLVGDINGDTLDDAVTMTGSAGGGNVYISYNQTNSFTASGLNPVRIGARAGSKYFLLDGDNDTRADLYVVSTDTKTGITYVEVARSNGQTFAAPTVIFSGPNLAQAVPYIANVGGGLQPEIIFFARSAYTGTAQGDVLVSSPAKNGAYGPLAKWHEFFCVGNEEPLVADFDRDGLADIATLTRNATGTAYVALSTGSSFNGASWNATGISFANQVTRAGDVNGDGRADFVTFTRSNPGPGQSPNRVMTSLTNAVLPGRQSGAMVERHSFFCTGDEYPLLGNLNYSDRQMDLLTFVRSSQGGTATGDVYASMSRFNNTDFDLNFALNPLACVRQQESNIGFYPGDEPYIVTIYFRSRLNTPGSTQIWNNNWANVSWAEGIRTGNSVAVPPGIGQTLYPALRPVTITDMLNRRQPEVIGSFTVVLESDLSNWGLVQPMVTSIGAAVRRELDTLIAGGGLDLNNPTQSINDASNRLRASLTPSALQAISFWTQSFGDPDDLLGFSLWMQPVVDPEVSAAMSFPTASWLSFTPFGTVSRASNTTQGFPYVGAGFDYRMGFLADPRRR